MPQDAFTLHHTALELDKTLKNARIDRINQPDNDNVVLDIRSASKDERLIFCLNAQTARVCLSNTKKENPITAPKFCMLLRKHITRAEIIKVEPIMYERIIKISMICKNELKESCEKQLYAEIMGKYSNLILVENGIILGALKQTSLDDASLRHIFCGQKYTLPPKQDKIDLSDENLALQKMQEFNGTEVEDIIEYIFNNFKGIAKQTANEIVSEYLQISGCIENNVILFKNIDFIRHFKAFYVTHKIKPCIKINNSNSDFFVFNYTSFDSEKTKYFDSISECVDQFYTKKENDKIFNLRKNKIHSVICSYEKKINKKMQIVLDKEMSCSGIDDIRINGELIIANLYRLKDKAKYCEVENYYLTDCPIVRINLDDNITPKENAERFFKKYDKQKKTLKAIEPQKVELQKVLEYIATLYKELDEAEGNEDFEDIEAELILQGILKPTNTTIKKQTKKLSTPRAYSYDGFEVFVGRNNIQNDRLTLSADRNDIFVHTKDYPSSHVIIRTYGKVASEKVILFACELSAYYSKARESNKVQVDYTLKKNVKKPSGFPTGKVIYSGQKSLMVKPNEHLDYLHN